MLLIILMLINLISCMSNMTIYMNLDSKNIYSHKYGKIIQVIHIVKFEDTYFWTTNSAQDF